MNQRSNIFYKIIDLPILVAQQWEGDKLVALMQPLPDIFSIMGVDQEDTTNKLRELLQAHHSIFAISTNNKLQ